MLFLPYDTNYEYVKIISWCPIIMKYHQWKSVKFILIWFMQKAELFWLLISYSLECISLCTVWWYSIGAGGTMMRMSTLMKRPKSNAIWSESAMAHTWDKILIAVAIWRGYNLKDSDGCSVPNEKNKNLYNLRSLKKIDSAVNPLCRNRYLNPHHREL